MMHTIESHRARTHASSMSRGKAERSPPHGDRERQRAAESVRCERRLCTRGKASKIGFGQKLTWTNYIKWEARNERQRREDTQRRWVSPKIVRKWTAALNPFSFRSHQFTIPELVRSALLAPAGCRCGLLFLFFIIYLREANAKWDGKSTLHS